MIPPPPPQASTPAVTLTPAAAGLAETAAGLAVDPDAASVTPSVTIPDLPAPTSSEPVLT